MEQDKADIGKVGTTTRGNFEFYGGGYLKFELNLTASRRSLFVENGGK